MTAGNQGPVARIGLLWRGDPAEPPPAPADTRFHLIFEEFAARGVGTEPVLYAEEAHEAVREQLLGLDGVLVWVDPIVRGRERFALDALLREVAAEGVFVSAHPDVIQTMGTKEVLYRTRDLPWGSDVRVYHSAEALEEKLAAALRSSGPRVLKQDRGSGGNHVWKLELVRDAEPAVEALVRVQPAARGATVEEMRLGDFVAERAPYFDAFEGTGRFVDQPYAERLADGMVRCYLAHDQVVGFGHQFVTALLPPAPGESGPPDPPARLYYGPEKPEFQSLRERMEDGWITEMQHVLGIEREALPVIWDADFLFGPKPAPEDTYVLCEVNVSGVFPIPDESIAPLVEAAVERTLAAKRRRHA